MKRNILLYLVSSMIFFSCSKPKDTLDLTGDVNIHSFSIDGVEGIIDPATATIKVIMPVGTDLTALAPTISLGTGATVTPASGQVIDFSESAKQGGAVTYTVSNTDLYQKYSVVVEEVSAKITSFRIGAMDAYEINHEDRTILVYMPLGTDVTALTPIIEYTEGAVISPAVNQAIDFTNPVVYTLSYQGSEFIYTVTVILGEPPVQPVLLYGGETAVPYVWVGIAAPDFNASTINPLQDSVNQSALCASITRRNEDIDEGGKWWSGGALWNFANIDPAKYGSFTIKVLKPVAGRVQFEIQRAGEQDKEIVKVDYTTPGQWQELTFVIPTNRTAMIDNILVGIHDADPGTFETAKMYWDEIIAIPK
ncbi:MAG: hypothetical protein LBQ31_03215 [Bacteroidales bacterium]|jgi:hypothetical protein|nr:hypothetical protein [Bacteroidales bacterium]